jgi:hypothetical protein
MTRWGYLGADADLEAATAIFRPGYAQAARPWPSVSDSGVKSEGQYAGPWLLPALPGRSR